MKTSELTGPALDWAVAKCEGVEVEYINDGITRCILRVTPFTGMYRPSTDWSQGGPIIERVIPTLLKTNGGEWIAQGPYDRMLDREAPRHYGPTPLIAAMRCFVASRLGGEVDVPEELQ